MDAIFSNYYPTFLYVDKYAFSDRWVYQEDNIPYSMFRYICSGSARFEVDGVPYEVGPDDVFYIPQGCALGCFAHEDIVFLSVRFLGSIQVPDVDMLQQLWNFRQLYNFSGQPEMRQWFEKIYHCALSRVTYKRLEIRGYLNLICAEIAKQTSLTEETEEILQREREMMESLFDMKYIRRRAMSSHRNTDPRIRILVDYLTLHPEKNVSRKEICEMCGVSDSSLRRLFKEQTGKTIYEFVREIKLACAANFLVTGNETISEIGYRLGYESPSYFTKIFRENYGVSPQDYRRLSQEA